MSPLQKHWQTVLRQTTSYTFCGKKSFCQTCGKNLQQLADEQDITLLQSGPYGLVASPTKHTQPQNANTPTGLFFTILCEIVRPLMIHVTHASLGQLLGLAETCDFYAMKESIS
jgi:hypothetical protein